MNLVKKVDRQNHEVVCQIGNVEIGFKFVDGKVYELYRLTSSQVLDMSLLYIPKELYAQAIKQIYGIFSN